MKISEISALCLPRPLEIANQLLFDHNELLQSENNLLAADVAKQTTHINDFFFDSKLLKNLQFTQK